MALTRQQKEKALDKIKENIGRQQIMIFTDYKGLKTKDLFELKKRLKKADSSVSVIKKTLLKLALREKKVSLKMANIEGQLALIFGFGDPLKAAKIVYDFGKERRLPQIIGGFFESQWQDKDKIIVLAQLPSKEELLSKFVGSLTSPLCGFMNVLQANVRDLVYVLSAIKK